ncbi:unnamed protein product [Didymodactylos carnosus]|uniref:Innexin n=1 Tax=Didymodactylos carnosus TaxID=1234261 RepID=A0A813P4Y8_9BILA|nr:unnamed protein product [Didymodactylos carnosus]CAF0805940.1 unnamed protein product [Didymodactylos carnosus]CAF3522192.1 unnamed protein product [Didymodactylos carnosus]CAF3589614.1 unnamed protein product [Didymodactylos carnosus]
MARYLKTYRSYLRFDAYALIRHYCGFGRNDDDFVDRLSRHYSVLIFSMFIIIVSSVQFVGKPISCWTPASFTDSHISYADFICWISSTYYVSTESEIPYPDEHREHSIIFYQYIPFLLMLQAFGFFFPGFLWRSLSKKIGFSIQKYIDNLNLSRTLLIEPPSFRQQFVHNVAIRLDQYFRLKHGKKKMKTVFLSQFPKLTILYLSIKLIYLCNILFQLFTLHYLMKFRLSLSSLVQQLFIHSTNYHHDSHQFPTNVLCDFIVRFLGKNTHRHTVQCVLPVNVFNEKIFTFSYLWLIIMMLFSIYNLMFQWPFYLINKYDFINDYLIAQNKKKTNKFKKLTSDFTSSSLINSNNSRDLSEQKNEQILMKNFNEHYLKTDGIVLLRLIKINTDIVTTYNLLDDIWDLYRIQPI